MPLRRDGGDIILAVRLTPKSSRARLGGVFTDSAGQHWLQATVTAPPDKGKANAALVALLAKTLRLPPSTIFLETGDTNRLKRLRLVAPPPEAEDLVRAIANRERSGT